MVEIDPRDAQPGDLVYYYDADGELYAIHKIMSFLTRERRFLISISEIYRKPHQLSVYLHIETLSDPFYSFADLVTRVGRGTAKIKRSELFNLIYG